MGTSASTQQDISPALHSNILASQNLPIQSIIQGQRSYAPVMPLNIETLDTSQLANLSPNPLLGSPTHTDGYKWRKYGQKSVKGNDFPRNYYKCTFPGCTVKKYVEKYEEDGKMMERVTYKGGEHTHDPSRVTRLNATDQTTFKQSVLSESVSHADLLVKTEPRPETLDIHDASVSGLGDQGIFPTSPRLVVETTADIDHNDDGYSWRKYGQKNVKGSSYPTPRSYYRCTQEDCPVKKQVEQRGNIIYNTYEGTHNHLAPGWDEKKKRKLNRNSLDKSIINRVIDDKKGLDSQEITDKTIEEGTAKGFHSHPTPEEVSLVMAEAAMNSVDSRSLIPLQELHHDSGSFAPGIPISLITSNVGRDGQSHDQQ